MDSGSQFSLRPSRGAFFKNQCSQKVVFSGASLKGIVTKNVPTMGVEEGRWPRDDAALPHRNEESGRDPGSDTMLC